MQRLTFGGGNVKIFQSDPITQFPLHVQESPSLELDTIGHQQGTLKNRSPSLLPSLPWSEKCATLHSMGPDT